MDEELQLATTIAGQDYILVISRHFIRRDVYYSVEQIDDSRTAGLYFMHLNRRLSRYTFVKGTMPKELKMREHELSERIMSHFHNYCAN